MNSLTTLYLPLSWPFGQMRWFSRTGKVRMFPGPHRPSLPLKTSKPRPLLPPPELCQNQTGLHSPRRQSSGRLKVSEFQKSSIENRTSTQGLLCRWSGRDTCFQGVHKVHLFPRWTSSIYSFYSIEYRASRITKFTKSNWKHFEIVSYISVNIIPVW